MPVPVIHRASGAHDHAGHASENARLLATCQHPDAAVLVVDDNEANRSLALHTLEDEGYRVVLAAGGEAAIALFARERPDCVLLDVRMPELDGFAVCERMRALPGGAETPIIFLTALRDVETFDRALRAGGDDFLTKPVRPTELVIRVQSALRLRRLSDELREHYALLKRQRDDLVRLQLQKERLMAFVVHDLKNPLNTMDLFAQFLVRDPTISEDARNSAEGIRRAARELGRMISNLLDLSKADEGKLTAKRADVDLEALVAGVTGELDLAARGREVAFEVALDGEHVAADEDLLRRTLANLLENAMRHAPRTTAVRVTCTRQSGSVELRVADAGAGIPAALKELVFEPFVQLQQGESPSSRGGHGLGLAFCRIAVEAHGGHLWIEDGNPGAVFALRIPDGE
jgi:two-component system, sensor histidine kinase and response regulator